MHHNPVDLNKMLEDTTRALQGLYTSLSSSCDPEIDQISNETTTKASELLSKVVQAASSRPDVFSDVRSRGSFVDILGKLEPKLFNSASVQQALGHHAADVLRDLFTKVWPIFHEKGSRWEKVSRKDSDPLNPNG